MRISTKLSAVALIAAMIASGPANAVSLNLGGGNGTLLNIGGDGGTNANVDVNTGDVLGDTNANVSLDTGNTTNANVSVNSGGSNGTDASVDINLGGSDDDLLDLFGNDPTSADVQVGDTGDVSVDLFGGGNDADAVVDLGGTDADVGLDLFGDDANVDVGLGDATGSIDVLTGTSAVVVDLFGGSDPMDGGANGNPAGDDGDLFGPTASEGSGGNSPGGNGGVRVADIDPSRAAACFTPNAAQIANLINRHAYTTATMASWRGATELKIVKIDLCADAESSIEASSNIAALQAYLGANATFRARLKSKGYGTDDVIAVDRNGKTLIVYVS